MERSFRMRLPNALCTGVFIAALLGASGCSPSLDPSGLWSRHQDLFTCDWEGGRNQGHMRFSPDGGFSESLLFRGTDRPFTTSASGRWWLVGETLTLDLTHLEGKNELAPSSERLKLMFRVARKNGFLLLTLTTIIHEDEDTSSHPVLTNVPDNERCTAIYERATE